MAVMDSLMGHPAMRYTTPRRSLVFAILFLVPAPLIALDLPGSIEEHRILGAWSVCSGADPETGPGCLASEEVTFGDPYELRRSALQEWPATNEDGQVALFHLQPGYDTATLPGRGFLFRVNGEIVAVGEVDSSTYIPTAMSGSHAITMDAFALLLLLGMSAQGVRTTITGRRAGLAWSDKILPQTLRRSRIDNAVGLAGAAGLFTTYVLALTGAKAWVPPLLIGAAVLLYPGAMRLIRRWRGTGRHAG